MEFLLTAVNRASLVQELINNSLKKVENKKDTKKNLKKQPENKLYVLEYIKNYSLVYSFLQKCKQFIQMDFASKGWSRFYHTYSLLLK